MKILFWQNMKQYLGSVCELSSLNNNIFVVLHTFEVYFIYFLTNHEWISYNRNTTIDITIKTMYITIILEHVKGLL